MSGMQVLRNPHWIPAHPNQTRTRHVCQSRFWWRPSANDGPLTPRLHLSTITPAPFFNIPLFHFWVQLLRLPTFKMWKHLYFCSEKVPENWRRFLPGRILSTLLFLCKDKHSFFLKACPWIYWVEDALGQETTGHAHSWVPLQLQKLGDGCCGEKKAAYFCSFFCLGLCTSRHDACLIVS